MFGWNILGLNWLLHSLFLLGICYNPLRDIYQSQLATDQNFLGYFLFVLYRWHSLTERRDSGKSKREKFVKKKNKIVFGDFNWELEIKSSIVLSSCYLSPSWLFFYFFANAVWSLFEVCNRAVSFPPFYHI